MLPVQFLNYGYTHKFRVDVIGTEVFYERDEECEECDYRALVNPDEVNNKKPDIELLQAIAEGIKEVLS